MEVLEGGPEQAAPAAADNDQSGSVDDQTTDMANPQQPASRTAADHDHYYCSADYLAMGMAHPQLGPAVVAPVEVSDLSEPVSVCLQGKCPDCMSVCWIFSLSLCYVMPVVSLYMCGLCDCLLVSPSISLSRPLVSLDMSLPVRRESILTV